MVRQLRIAIVNVGDDIGSSLVHFFYEKGIDVLGIDEEGSISNLPPGGRSLAIETGFDPQPLAESILRGLREERDIDVLINNFGPGLATVSMAKGHLWAFSATPQVKASFATTRAFLSVLKQSPGLVVNLGLGTGPADRHCPMRYALVGFAHSLGLMDLANVQVVNLCLHNLYGQQPGRCSRCAADALLTAKATDATVPFQHLSLTGYRQVSELVLEAIDKFRKTTTAEAGEG
jgi:NAD(P)-dependent dehydrogenase (short-subunit alcohol dehydrogenase family)